MPASVALPATLDQPHNPIPTDQTRPTKSRWSRQVAADVVGLLEALAIAAAAMLPALIYASGGELSVQWTSVLQNGLLCGVVYCVILRSWSMYDTAQMNEFPIRPLRLMCALLLAFSTVHGLGMPFKANAGHMWIWYAVWLSAGFALVLWIRILTRWALAGLTTAGRFDTRVAVFGAGPIARRVHDHLTDPKLGISFAGVFDDRKDQERLNPEGLTINGRLDDLIEAGRAGLIDQIIIALPQTADGRTAAVAKRLEQLPVSLHIVSHISSDLMDIGASHRVSNIGPVGLLDVKCKPLTDWGPLLKRCEDYVLGALLLVISAPVLLLCAAAVKLDSPGPILFRQRRRGLNHRVFEVLKFRTMSVLEDGADVTQATVNDVRVTRVGRILRRTSLDELPQLLNVMKGEMSLVGPRPHALVHDQHWGSMLETYANRSQVKPGITGYAQVMGWRGETETNEKMQARVEHDLAYIAGWSLGQDVKILGQTVRAVVRGDNAK
jgi:Undecaprenyl-phosphate glucose phosphotransferase